MRFFTRDLWLGAQKRTNDNHLRWQEAFRDYRAQLEALRDRLTIDAFAFFADVSLHDGELLELVTIDGSRPAPLNAEVRPWRSLNNNPVRVEMAILDAYDQYVWRLSYANLRRVLVDFPSDRPLFHGAGEGFGDWGYDELTDGGDGFLRHEVLFRSGSTLLFEFREVQISRTSRSEPGLARDDQND